MMNIYLGPYASGKSNNLWTWEGISGFNTFLERNPKSLADFLDFDGVAKNRALHLNFETLSYNFGSEFRAKTRGMTWIASRDNNGKKLYLLHSTRDTPERLDGGYYTNESGNAMVVMMKRLSEEIDSSKIGLLQDFFNNSVLPKGGNLILSNNFLEISYRGKMTGINDYKMGVLERAFLSLDYYLSHLDDFDFSTYGDTRKYLKDFSGNNLKPNMDKCFFCKGNMESLGALCSDCAKIFQEEYFIPKSFIKELK